MIRGVAWVGVRTERFIEMMDFYRNVMGLAPTLEIPGQFAMFDLPDGDQIELFGTSGPFNPHFPASPVAEFLVEDVEEARPAMERAGVKFVHAGRDDKTGTAWAHYIAPDRNLYGITHRRISG